MKNKAKSGKVYEFPFFKNVALSFRECYKAAPCMFTLYMLFSFLHLATSTLSPLFITKFIEIIELGLVHVKTTEFILYGVGLFAVELLDVVNYTVELYFYDVTNIKKVEPHLTKNINEKLTKLKFGYFYSKEFKDDYNMALYAIGGSSIISLSVLIKEIVGKLVGIGISMFTLAYINVYAVLVCILPAIAMFALCMYKAKASFKYTKEFQNEVRQSNRLGRMLKNHRSIRELRANKSQSIVTEDWENHFSEGRKYWLKEQNLWRGVQFGTSVITLVTFIAIMVLLVFLIKTGQVQVAGFAGIITAATKLLSGTEMLASTLGKTKSTAMAVDQYRKILVSTQVEQENSEMPAEKFKELEFKNVSFAYPEFTLADGEKLPENAPEVLKNVSFKIKKGERIAIVGENGCGKTTLTKLVLNLFQPTSGEILFNNKPLAGANLKGYRENFSVINQEYAHLQLPIFDSVTASVINATDSEVLKALKAAGADDVIEKINEHEGLSTWLSREFDGVELSGGQKQKVAIARGLLKQSEVLVVDEPTSALDPLVEEKILNNILGYTKGKTAIVISHRLSLCSKVDRVMYLENGEIVEFDSHQNLMKKRNGKYKKLFNMQAKWYKD